MKGIVGQRFSKSNLFAILFVPPVAGDEMGIGMNEEVKKCVDKYPDEIKEMYWNLRQIIMESISSDVEERLWAKLPSYYVGDNVVRLIPFKDHINIEAAAVEQYKEELLNYKITPKGMLQIYGKQNVPQDILKQIFEETLMG